MTNPKSSAPSRETLGGSAPRRYPWGGKIIRPLVRGAGRIRPAPISVGRKNPTSRSIPFTKMVGTGNDFLIVDAVHRDLRPFRRRWPVIARALCDRRYGVGADGLLLLESSRVGDARMRIFNPDGSEASMCGNGARCVAYVIRKWPGRRQPEVSLETAAGTVQGRVQGDRVQIRMSSPRGLRLNLRVAVDGRSYRLSRIDTGVPHVVMEVRDLERCDVEGLGRALRVHRAFQPRGANVNFIAVNPKTPNAIRVRTYERGVEAETLACGTGAVASAIVYAWLHPVAPTAVGAAIRRRVAVTARSGERLMVSFRLQAAGEIRDVILEGPVQWICEGTVRWPLQTVNGQRTTRSQP